MFSKLKIAINLIVWVVFTVYLYASYTFKDVIFFWMLWGISYSLQTLSHQISSIYLAWRHSERIKLALSKVEPLKVIEGAVDVYNWDSNNMAVDDFNKHYEQLGSALGAKIWKDDHGITNEVSARNIVAQFLGLGIDPEVSRFIYKESTGKKSK